MSNIYTIIIIIKLVDCGHVPLFPRGEDRARSGPRINSRMIPLVQGTSPPGKFDGLGFLQDDVGPAAWVALLLFAALLFSLTNDWV
jgi:hypothetical protein